MNEIDYADVIELGFKREEMFDSIFFGKYGFNWFLVTLEVSKSLIFQWDCNNRKVELVRYDKKGIDIQNILLIEDYSTLVEMVNFYTKQETKNDSMISVKTNEIMF